MRNKFLVATLSLVLTLLFSASPWISLSTPSTSATVRSTDLIGLRETSQKSEEVEQPTEVTVNTAKHFDIGNHLTNGSFGTGTNGFSSMVGDTNKFNVVTSSDGNLYATVTYDSGYQCFVSDQTSLQASTSYTFSFDYYVASDNPNMFACGLSTVAGHPGTGQALAVSGAAPYTVTNLSTNTVVLSSSGNTSLVRYGRGARTLAADGVDRTASADVGGWMRFTTTFTLANNAPSVYFYFMSFEQGKQADGTTPLAFVTSKTISFDNIIIKGLYNVSVSTGDGGKAEMNIIDTTPYTGKVYESGRVEYTATPSYQNEFSGWSDDNNNIVSTDLTYIARPNSNTHLTATFLQHNGVKTYGGEYSLSDEILDTSTNASRELVSNTSGITVLGESNMKVYGSSTYRYLRYGRMTLQPNTNYTLSFYLYYTGTGCHFGLFRDTGFSPNCGSVIQKANWYTTASLNYSEVTTGGETTLGSATLRSSDNFLSNTANTSGKWVHYTMTFNSGSFEAEDNILTASGAATEQNPITATSYYTSDYNGTAYFALRYDGVPSLSSYVLLDNVSLTESCSITMQPTAGGTISSDVFGGTISSSTTKTVLNGTNVTLTATPDTGKGFVAWVDENNVPVSYEKTYTFFATSNRTIKPIFDTANKVYNGDFALDETGWTAYGDSASNVDINVLDSADLETENIPDSPSGHNAFKLSFDRTDSLLNKRVQAYSNYTFATENNKTYEISAWVYSKYIGSRIALYVPTTNRPYHQDAVNDFTYVGSGYNIGATQLAGSYQYLLNDQIQSQTGTYSLYSNINRSVDITGNQNGWTKLSIRFTTDDNINCVQNASISLATTSYSKNGVDYTSGCAYFTDVSVKVCDNISVENNKLGGTVTANDELVVSSRDLVSIYGAPLNLKADTYKGFLFDGWYRNNETIPFTNNSSIIILNTGVATYTAKYQYDTSKSNLFLDDFETLYNTADIENNGTNDLGVWKLLSNYTGTYNIGDYVSWGNYTVTNGDSFQITPHSGTNMMTVYGRNNTSFRLMDVTPNTNYMLSFYWYQKTGTSNKFYSAAVTENTDDIKVGSSSEYADSNLTQYFLAENFTNITSDGTWKKYTLTFDSGDNTTLKLFLRYTAGTSSTDENLFLDDFSLLPINAELATGTVVPLSVSNDMAPLNTTFRGISSTVYHCYTYMNDKYGRNYTDEMAELEMDRLKSSGVKMVRTIFKSQFAWDDAIGDWNWNSERMQDVYQWASELQDRGINIALNAGWDLLALVNGTSGTPEVPYLYANGDYTLACARYGEWITEALQAFENHGIHNISHLMLFTEPSSPTESNQAGDYSAQYVQAVNALNSALILAGIRNNYKLVGPNQNSTNGGLMSYALQNCDNAIDIYSSHYYPKSTTIYDDAFGTNATAAFTSFMSVLTNHNSTKDFWGDEYFAYAPSNTPLGMDSAWAGTQTAVGMTSAMNAGVEGLISWQQFDQLWVDQMNTIGTFVNGIHASGTAPSLLVSAVPKHQYYALTLMSKYLGSQNGQVYTSTSPSGSGLYISTVQLENGAWSVMVVNTSQSSQKFEATFASAINQSLYRHLYNPATIEPDARAKMIEADKVYNNVSSGFVDTIPSGGIAIYTSLDF